VNQHYDPFCGRFDYVVLICPTFAYNKTLYRFAERDPRLFVIICEQQEVELWLKIASFVFEGANTLIVLDDYAASKDVKGRTSELVKLSFSAHLANLSAWVLTQQLSSIAKTFHENVAAIVLFYTPSARRPQAADCKAERAPVLPPHVFSAPALRDRIFELEKQRTDERWTLMKPKLL